MDRLIRRITVMGALLAALLLLAAPVMAQEPLEAPYEEVLPIVIVPQPPAVQPPAAQLPAVQPQPEVAAAPQVVAQAQPGELARTGFGVSVGALLALSLLALGGAALLVARRRTVVARH